MSEEGCCSYTHDYLSAFGLVVTEFLYSAVEGSFSYLKKTKLPCGEAMIFTRFPLQYQHSSHRMVDFLGQEKGLSNHSQAASSLE